MPRLRSLRHADYDPYGADGYDRTAPLATIRTGGAGYDSYGTAGYDPYGYGAGYEAKPYAGYYEPTYGYGSGYGYGYGY